MKRIVGRRYNEMFFSADVFNLDLGDNYADEDGDPMPEFSLSVLGNFRFEAGDAVLLRSQEILAEHGRDGRASTGDSRVLAVADALRGKTVAHVELAASGDLTVAFTGGIRFVFEGKDGSFALHGHHEYAPFITFGKELS